MLELGVAGDVEHEAIGRYIQQSSVDLLFTFGESASRQQSNRYPQFGKRNLCAESTKRRQASSWEIGERIK